MRAVFGRRAVREAVLASLFLFTVPRFEVAAQASLPSSDLSVKVTGEWRRIWRAEEAPSAWRGAHPEMLRAVRWSGVVPGIQRAEVTVAGDGLAWRTRLILVRLDPARVNVTLASAVREGGTLGAWSVAAAPADALLALNAGQFRGARPWGWLVRDGRELQAPGTGTLGMALVVDRSGRIGLVPPDSIAVVRAQTGVIHAFQSYPMLLMGNGDVPVQLQAAERGVDVRHRDSRLAVGQLRDGQLLIVLTRFEALGGALQSLPFGPTVPEMAALLGALGCESAMLLDGGLSGQLLIRDVGGETSMWAGMRRVPLGLVVQSRS